MQIEQGDTMDVFDLLIISISLVEIGLLAMEMAAGRNFALQTMQSGNQS